MKVYILKEHGGFEPAEDADVTALLVSPEAIFWVDMEGPSPDDVKVMHDVFHFHPLAIDDTMNQRQRPKVEEYGETLFTIINTVHLQAAELIFHELDVFLGHNYLVTVHTGNEPLIREVQGRCKTRAAYGKTITIGFLLYTLVDTVVDSYFPVLDTIGDLIETMSEDILERPRREVLEPLFRLKRTLTEMWRVAGQQRDMFGVLTRENSDMIRDESLRYYLRDVYDHLLRISDTVNTFRDTLSNLIDLYLSAVSNRLNIVVQRLTVVTLGIGTLTVISGFYGMNFETTWPSFGADWGVLFVLGLMVVAIAVVVFVLRWLER
jgi:magnesium transporter